MKDGWYWVNDKSRYGWEVVEVIGNNLYRANHEGGQRVDSPPFKDAKFIFIEWPKPQ